MPFDFEEIIKYSDKCYLSELKAYSSTIGGNPTLYATCYSVLLKLYLGIREENIKDIINFILSTQDSKTGYFIGPELKEWSPLSTSTHNMEHILLHLACAVLPVLQEYKVKPKYSLFFAHKYCKENFLCSWLNARDFSNSWLEGNNLLSIGQLLIYLRDVECFEGAGNSLSRLLQYLDSNIDSSTGLWGTNCGSSLCDAIYGGYHQYLIYYYENHPLAFKKRLIDKTLSIQHPDGSFSPHGDGGACEDADAVDILVNMFERINYRRNDIRCALQNCLKHLEQLQNNDGGFPYNMMSDFSHMGIPDTASKASESNMFSTWFRVHTISLISRIIPDNPLLQNRLFFFNTAFGMGWHREISMATINYSHHKMIRMIFAPRYYFSMSGKTIKVFFKRLIDVQKRMIKRYLIYLLRGPVEHGTYN
jgi:hypothetical protein